MAFYHYSQNNSGGSFEGDYHHIIIEANSAHEADARAEREAGVYFDGCDSGMDCECCGDRWSRAWGDGNPEPLIYGKKPADYEDMWGLKTLILYADRARRDVFPRGN